MRSGDLEVALRVPSSYSPSASLVCLENTHNGAGGRITPLAGLRALRDVSNAHALPVHLDGARLWNACAASGTAPYEYAACADTVMVSFSKGLGAPVGAALAGSASVIEAADGARKRFGGGMRQSGIIAAGALYGIMNHMDRLSEDHEHARLFANAIDGIRGATLVPPDTNIVMLDLPPELDAAAVVAAAAKQGILLSRWTPSRIRAVTHLDADAGAVLKAAEGLARVLEEA
jgi:threonine aldolase